MHGPERLVIDNPPDGAAARAAEIDLVVGASPDIATGQKQLVQGTLFAKLPERAEYQADGNIPPFSAQQLHQHVARQGAFVALDQRED